MYGFAPFTRKSEGTTIEAIWILGSFGTKFSTKSLIMYLISRKQKSFSFYKNLCPIPQKDQKVGIMQREWPAIVKAK